MKLDTAVREFVETYDAESMSYIERLSNEFGLNANRIPFHAFNIKESFSIFDEYLKGFCNYECTHQNNPHATPYEIVHNDVVDFIENHIIKEEDILYKDIPGFITAYTEGCDSLSKSVDEIKNRMIVEGVNPEIVGDVNEYVDLYMSKLQDAFKPVMEKALLASGYTNVHRRTVTNEDKNVRPVPVFL